MWPREHLMEVYRCYYRQRGHRQGSLLRLAQLKKEEGLSASLLSRCLLSHLQFMEQQASTYGICLDVWPVVIRCTLANTFHAFSSCFHLQSQQLHFNRPQ